ncbi:MAG TPA: SMC-Scp complex subunit ScpB [Candidatus Binataceae bacterium]
MEDQRLKSILESLLFAAGEPVTIARLAAVFDDIARATVQTALTEMASAYAAGNRGIVLEEVAGGYQFRSAREHAGYVRKLLAARPPRLSRPLLETLAIIAYRQPVTRPEIEQLRGVDSGGVLETLLERRFVKIAGRKEAPGRPMVYATTAEFLEVFGLKDLDSLPDLKEFREIERSVEEATVAPIEAVETFPDSPPQASSQDASATDDEASQILAAAHEAEPVPDPDHAPDTARPETPAEEDPEPHQD